MAREIFYAFNASAPPPDPTVNSTKYIAPIQYPVGGGYFKAIAYDGGEYSPVIGKSFERGVVLDYLVYYPLDLDYLDISGNDYDATKTSGTTTFSGTDMFISSGACIITIPDIVRTILNGNNSASLSFWFKEGSDSFNGCPINFKNSSNGSENHLNYSGTHYLGILRNDRISKSKTSPANTKIYHHYAFTSEWKMYIDGQLYWTGSKGILNMGTGNINFGNGYGGSSCYLKKFRIYNREITASEVTEIYNSELI